jgi:hypothetical protein
LLSQIGSGAIHLETASDGGLGIEPH